MEEVKGFFDLCISEVCFREHGEKTAKQLQEMGYRTVAINQVVDEANLETKKKKKKGETREIADVVPAPYELSADLLKKYDNIKFLNRLTIVFSNQDVIHKIIKSPNYKKYHIIAVLPLTQPAFQFTCSNIEADIFTFDAENKPTYKLNRKLYKSLTEKGYHFEIPYVPAIKDGALRRNTIQTAHLYHSLGKSRNIIISSWATDPLFIRSPYDIINLAFIFGLSEEQAKNSVSFNGRQVYVCSVSRRCGRPVIFIQTQETVRNVRKKQEESEDDEMQVDEPAQKRTKQ